MVLSFAIGIFGHSYAFIWIGFGFLIALLGTIAWIFFVSSRQIKNVTSTLPDGKKQKLDFSPGLKVKSLVINTQEEGKESNPSSTETEEDQLDDENPIEEEKKKIQEEWEKRKSAAANQNTGKTKRVKITWKHVGYAAAVLLLFSGIYFFGPTVVTFVKTLAKTETKKNDSKQKKTETAAKIKQQKKRDLEQRPTVASKPDTVFVQKDGLTRADLDSLAKALDARSEAKLRQLADSLQTLKAMLATHVADSIAAKQQKKSKGAVLAKRNTSPHRSLGYYAKTNNGWVWTDPGGGSKNSLGYWTQINRQWVWKN
jgi:hypothetical protein